MPKVTTFMYAEGTLHDTDSSGKQRLQVVSPMHIFTPVFVPGTMSFSVIFGILGVDNEKDSTLKFVFYNAKTKENLVEIDQINLPKNNDPGITELPKNMRGIMVNLSFQNVILRNDGEYYSEVYFNDESLGTFPISVQGREKLT